jgi:exodeoxyribonuclease (lambda-induced)
MKTLTGFKQNSLEWLQARAGVVTASEADNLITPKFKVRDGKMIDTYLAQKLAERWTGSPVAGYMSIAMDEGRILEEEAVPWVEFELNAAVERPAFIISDCGRFGCSPDGMIGDMGLEIKCPQSPNHVKYLLSGTIPDDYIPQVQFSMYVTGSAQWRFLSYSRRFPKLNIIVERDEAAMAAIGDALASFIPRLDAAYARLVELNGGEPKRPKIKTPVEPEYRFDIH